MTLKEAGKAFGLTERGDAEYGPLVEEVNSGGVVDVAGGRSSVWVMALLPPS